MTKQPCSPYTKTHAVTTGRPTPTGQPANPIKDWHGVTTDTNTGRVTRLRLPNNGLHGPLPAQLGNLAHLTQLDLSGNTLTGAIPTALGNLTRLTSLHLHNPNNYTIHQKHTYHPTSTSTPHYKYTTANRNQLTGAIPDLSQLTALTSLRLEGNKLTGTIPAALGQNTALTNLHLYDNQLTGTIPAELGQLTSLTHLHLQNNRLTGPIRQLNGLHAIEQLNLSGNHLDGTLTNLSTLTNLKYLHLQNNNLTGTVPDNLGALNKLTNTNSLQIDTPALCRPANLYQTPWNTKLNPCPITPTAPGAPGAPIVTATVGTALEVSWTLSASNAATVTGYTVAHRKAPSSTPATADWTETTTTTNRTTITGLDKNTTYHIRVRATNNPTPGNPKTGPWSPTTPQNTTPNKTATTDRDTLTAIYHKTSGQNWNPRCHLRWNTQQPLSKWGTRRTLNPLTGYHDLYIPRVSTDTQGRVTRLDLANCGLTGAIPAEIAQLTQLTDLRLDGNHLTGAIPAALGDLANLTRLHLYNHNNYAPTKTHNHPALYYNPVFGNIGSQYIKIPQSVTPSPLLHLPSLAQ